MARSALQVIGEWTRALQEDSHFLCRNRLMDYSLLLILYRTGPPSVSIIDYLQVRGSPQSLFLPTRCVSSDIPDGVSDALGGVKFPYFHS